METVDDLSRRRFILRGLVGCLGFSYYFLINANAITDFSTTESDDISAYLEENCTDGLERAIIYIPKTRKIEDISTERKPDLVSFSYKKISEALNRVGHVVFAHSHIVSLSGLFDPTDPEHIKAMEKYGEDVLKRRLMRQAPSSKSQSDMAVFLELLYENFSRSKNPKDGGLTLEFQIVVLDKGVKPQVIRVAVKKELMDRIRDFDYPGELGAFMISENIRKETGIYRDTVDEYYQSHADVFEISDKPEPSFPELAKLINEKTNFLIRY